MVCTALVVASNFPNVKITDQLFVPWFAGLMIYHEAFCFGSAMILVSNVSRRVSVRTSVLKLHKLTLDGNGLLFSGMMRVCKLIGLTFCG